MPGKSGGTFFEKFLDAIEVEFKLPLGILGFQFGEIKFKANDPALKWWRSRKAKQQLQEALQRAETNFQARHPGNPVARMLDEFSMVAEEDFRRVVAGLLTHLEDKDIIWFATTRLEHEWGNRISPQNLRDGLTLYLPFLQHELIGIPEFREVINALKIERMDRTLTAVDQKQDRVLDALSRVGEGVDRIERQRVQKVEGKPTFYVPFPHNEKFVGRGGELEQLHEILMNTETAEGRPAMLSGMGGIGKTQLAVEYAYKYEDEYPGGVYWINAADDWNNELASLAGRVGLSADDALESQRTTRLARMFVEFLKGHPDALLIFDNVEDPRSLLAPVVDGRAPVQLPCKLLFTTRHRETDLPFETVEVKVLPDGAALQVLLGSKARQGILELPPEAPEPAEAVRICRMLGCLPLALVLAAAYLGKNDDVTLPGYRRRLERDGLKPLDESGADRLELATRHDTAVTATLAAQWNGLKNEQARLVLQAAALLGEAAVIPAARLSFLTGFSREAEDGYSSPLNQCLRLLQEACLVETLGPGEIRLHPLVRAYVRDRIPDRDQFAESCVQRLADALWDVPCLDAEIAGRGVDDVIRDLRTGLDLFQGRSDETVGQLAELMNVLDREAHNLRKPFRSDFPAYTLQQLRDQALYLDASTLVQTIDVHLAHSRQVWFTERTPTVRASNALIRTFDGHTDSVESAAISPDGRRAISGSRDNTLRLWDLESGECLRTFEGHTENVVSVAIHPDGRRALSGSVDFTLRLWDLENGQCLRTFEGHTGMVESVAIHPDGRRALSGSVDCTLRLWDLENGQCLRTFEGHTGMVERVAIHPDGRHALSGSVDCTLRLWDLENGQCLRTFEGHTDSVTSVAIHPDGRRALSGSWDRTLRLWDLESGECLRTFEAHTEHVVSVAIHPDGQRALSGSWDRTLRLWDLESGECLRTFEAHTEHVVSVAIHPDGQRALSGSWDRTLRLWDLESEEYLGAFEGHVRKVTSVAIHPDGRRAISGSLDGTLRMWDLESGKCLRTFEGHVRKVTGVVIHPDGRRAISGSTDFTLRLWDLENGQCLRTFEGPTLFVEDVAIHPDGRRAIIGSFGRTLRLWDLESGECLRTFEGHTENVVSVAIHPDGRRALSGSVDFTLRLWDLENGQCLRTFEGHTGMVESVAIHPDGRHALSGSVDCTLRLWDLENGQCLRTFEGHASSVTSVAIHPDGRRAISGSRDNTLRLWDLETGKCLMVFIRPAPLMCLAIDPAGSLVVAGDEAGAMHFIELRNGDSVTCDRGTECLFPPLHY